jgi:hypothetical protein
LDNQEGTGGEEISLLPEERLTPHTPLNLPVLGSAAEDANLPVLREEGDEDEDGLPDHAELQDDGSVILPLFHPKTIRYRTSRDKTPREEEVKQLHLHRLTGADMRVLSAAGPEERLAVMIGRSSRMEHKTKLYFDALDAADVTAAGQVINHFLGSGPRTGRST